MVFQQYISTIFAGLMNRLIILLVLSGISFFSFGQEKWDLRKCVDYAMQNNITIKQQDIQAQIAQLTYQQSDASKYPNLNLGSDLGITTGRSIDPNTNLFTTQTILFNSFSLQSNVNVFNWFSKRNVTAGYNYDAQAAY